MAKMDMIGAALVAAVALAGCCDKENCTTGTGTAEGAPAATQAAKDPNEVVVCVDGAKLTRGELDAQVAKIVEAQGDAIPAAQRAFAVQQIGMQLAQTFLVETVLANKARALGYDVTDEDLKAREADILKTFAGRPDAPASIEEAAEKSPLGKEHTLAEFRTGVLIDKMLRGEVEGKNTKDYTAEAQKIIDEIVADNAKSAGSATEALDKIKAFKATLDATPAESLEATFMELAKANSDCPSKAKGGDLGEFTRGQMVPEFEAVAFAQEVGQISDPVKTKFGWHLVMTTGKTPATEAKDDAPAAPEKVSARHILIRVQEPQDVPDLERVVKFIRAQEERGQVIDFIQRSVRDAKVETSKDFSSLLPPPEEEEEEPVPAVEPVAEPVAVPEPVAEPVAEPIAEPVAEPVVSEIPAEPVATDAE